MSRDLWTRLFVLGGSDRGRMVRRYTDTLREALPPNLVGLLDWELPLARLPDNYDRQPLKQTQGLAKM